MKSIVESYGDRKNEQSLLVEQIDKKQDENLANLKNHFDSLIEK